MNCKNGLKYIYIKTNLYILELKYFKFFKIMKLYTCLFYKMIFFYF